MTFQQVLTAIWRNRVMITGVAVAFCSVVFGLLFVFHAEFQRAMVNLAITAATTLFYILGVALVLSMMWKKTVSNMKGGGGGKK